MRECIRKFRTPITYILLMLFIPVILAIEVAVLRDKGYGVLIFTAAIISCIPLLYAYERRESSSTEQVIIAVLVAISVVGRFVFAWLPGFKPVTAITIIVALWFGKEAGFVVGSLSAVVSNFYFGQGPWTVFQMFAWGFIGFLAGVLFKRFGNNKILLYVYGAVAGIMYSLTMDTWTTIWTDGHFEFQSYLVYATTSLPVTIEYAVSNVIFLMLLAKPLGKKLVRVKKKYGLFMD